MTVIPHVETNFHPWAILLDNLMKKCSLTTWARSFFHQIIEQPRLKAENFARFWFCGELLTS